MSQSIFKRMEVKYLLSEETYNEIMKRLEPYMSVDEYGLSTITSIYYDTEGYDIIRESMEKPVYKEKFRIRCYGDITEDSKVYLELKKKFKGVVYKRRTSLKYRVAYDYLDRGIYPEKESQILKEIDYFLKFYKPTNKTFIRYNRIAMFGKEDPELRITFDSDICAQFGEGDLMGGSEARPIIKAGERLMEIKVFGAMPLWLTEILSELKIYPTSFSKYGTACSGRPKKTNEEQ